MRRRHWGETIRTLHRINLSPLARRLARMRHPTRAIVAAQIMRNCPASHPSKPKTLVRAIESNTCVRARWTAANTHLLTQGDQFIETAIHEWIQYRGYERIFTYLPGLRRWYWRRHHTMVDASACGYIKYRILKRLAKRRRKLRQRSPFKRFYMAGLTTFLITGIGLFYMAQSHLAEEERVGLIDLIVKAGKMLYQTVFG